MTIPEEMVRKLQPGDELDALVEQYVFGAQWQSAKAIEKCDNIHSRALKYIAFYTPDRAIGYCPSEDTEYLRDMHTLNDRLDDSVRRFDL